MSGKKNDISNAIQNKLEYLGLDLEKIPRSLKKYEDLEYRISKTYTQNQHRQYRYIPIKDIQILLSPTNRLDDIEEKYKKASPLADYLDSKTEENILKYTTFLKMLNQFSIEEVEEIEKEQENLNKKIPFKVKYENNYLWQIYYSENTDKYFMIVSTEDTNYSAFFYLLKKQLEKKRTGKIFVPIKNLECSNTYLRKSELDDLENYLWLFTKNWPVVYEVYDKNDNLTIQIIGETEIYQKVKSQYKITLENQEDAVRFYKLLKAMFILQTELASHFTFKTNISKSGEIEFYLEDRKIEYIDIADWINEQYRFGENRQKETEDLIETSTQRLEQLKIEIAAQEYEYLAKEKQISTFLECKKTFFGRFKYYFKYSGKKNKNKKEQDQQDDVQTVQEDEISEEENTDTLTKKKRKSNNTIESLIELYKKIEEKEHILRNLIMDINSLKLKHKNMEKKIENATAFIQEIDSHKKSIFEFWKYSNKDEIAALPEGEEEEVNIIKKITKTFDYEEDLEKFGKNMDELQRDVLNKNETDSVFITTTNLLEILNKIKINDFLPKDIDNKLKELKKEAIEEKTLLGEEIDIFGGAFQDSTKISKIKNKKHRELPKDKFNILEINKNTKQLGFKLSLENVISNVKDALSKVNITEEIPVYKAVLDDKLDDRQINVFNINAEEEMQEAVKKKSKKINFYKINLPQGSNAISFTNCIFYDNQNKTLPVGQDLSTKILVDTLKLDLKLNTKSTFRILDFEDENDEFSKVSVKTVNVFELDGVLK